MRGVEADDSSVLSRVAADPDAIAHWGPGADDVADVRLGAPDRPLVVMLHGGFWRPSYDRLHLRSMTKAIATAGWTVVAPEYRRVPRTPDATCQDVRAALRVLPIDLRGTYDGRVIVAGHSAGGHLALWAAASAPAAGLHATLALAPVADLAAADAARLGDDAVHAFLGGPASTRTDLDPVRLVSPATPVRLLHGADDDTVPMHLSEAYAAAHPGAELQTLPGTGHFALIDPLSRAWPHVIVALDQLSGGPPARAAKKGSSAT
jgi:acetyl esterase/lipase